MAELASTHKCKKASATTCKQHVPLFTTTSICMPYKNCFEHCAAFDKEYHNGVTCHPWRSV